MRIGIDIRPFLKEETGVGVYLKNLLFHLSRIDFQNEYFLFSASWKDRFSSEKEPPFKHKKFRHFRLPVTLINYCWYRWGWPPIDYFFGGRLDVVHSPTPIIIPTRGKKIITIYDLFFLREPDQADETARKFFLHRLKNSVQQAEAIITISQASAHDIISSFPQVEGKVRVIYLGVDPEAWTLSEGEREKLINFKKAEDLPQEYFLFVGAFEPRKNLLRLIEAFHILHQQGRRESLVLVGREGRDSWKIKNKLRELGLEQFIKIKEYSSAQKLRYYYHGAKALLFPSLAEGFGLPLLEAMACQLPVIASRAPAIPEVAGDAALYFEPTSAEDMAAKIIQFLDQSTLRDSLIQAGGQRMTTFSWDKTAALTLHLYQELGR
jgi:glycosyltransferase involved in cell wall biosynthesis